MTVRAFVVCCLGLLAAAGCASEPAPPGTAPSATRLGAGGELAGRTYVVERLTDATGSQAPVTGSDASVRFGRAGGIVTGCNGISIRTSIEDDELVSTLMARTEIGCAEPLVRQEEWLADFFDGRSTIRPDGDRLTLTAGDRVLDLRMQTDADLEQQLTRSSWSLFATVRRSATAEEMSATPRDVELTITFADGSLSLDPAVCDTSSVPVELAGDRFTVLPGGTEPDCSGATDVEQRVAELLVRPGGQVTQDVYGSELTLVRDGSGFAFDVV